MPYLRSSRRRSRFGVGAVAAIVVLLGSAAVAAAAVRAGAGTTARPASESRAFGQYRFRVTAVTHSSSAQKTDLPFYTGRSTSTWRLAPATKRAPNVVNVAVSPTILLGAGMVNIKGVFTAEAKTDTDQCSLTAPTGSREYPAVAPAPFMLAIAPDPKSTAHAFVAMDGSARPASINNPYFGTGCSTSGTGQPDGDDTNLIRVRRTVFRNSTITLRSSGSSTEGGIAYTWSTTIVLKKIVKRR